MYIVRIITVVLLVIASVFSLPLQPGIQDNPVAPGIQPDPENCKNYYLCGTYTCHVQQRCWLYVCGADLLFDADLLVCNYADVVDCGDRPNPYMSSTTESPIFPTSQIITESSETTTLSTSIPYEPTEKPTPTIDQTTSEIDTSTFSTTNEITTTITTTIQTSTMPNVITTSQGHDSRYPNNVVGIYITLADDTVEGFETDSDWDPKLFEYQQTGTNVLFFTFINPETMQVPKSFQKLAATKGSLAPGSVPSNTKIIFAIGGYEYSLRPNPWDWLTSQRKAEEMAEIVAEWPNLYGCDGIDLDIEAGAGDRSDAGPNMVYFLQRLRQLQPNMIVGQPTYGYPQVHAENYVINQGFNEDATSNNLIDSVGLMVYEGTQSLNYVKNYAEATNQWEGFPITSNTPYHAILLGCKGTARGTDIDTLVSETLRQDLLGIMVWYASVKNGFQYEASWDASTSQESQQAYIRAMQTLSL